MWPRWLHTFYNSTSKQMSCDISAACVKKCFLKFLTSSESLFSSSLHFSKTSECVSAGERPSVIRDEQLFSQYGPRGAAGVHSESWESGRSTRKPAERGIRLTGVHQLTSFIFYILRHFPTLLETKVKFLLVGAPHYTLFTCYSACSFLISSKLFHLILSDILQEVTFLTNETFAL